MPAGDVAKVDAYLGELPEPQRKALQRMRAQIRAAAPGAQEGFGYGLPGFYLDGPLFYYGAGKSHLALYGSRPPGFEADVARFATTKGTLRFTPDDPLPAALVRRLVKARVAQNKAGGQGKPRKAASRAKPARKALARRAPVRRTR
jgi:uncharacterized protein YdhG (YjbR/CyaY superfamily)